MSAKRNPKTQPRKRQKSVKENIPPESKIMDDWVIKLDKQQTNENDHLLDDTTPTPSSTAGNRSTKEGAAQKPHRQGPQTSQQSEPQAATAHQPETQTTEQEPQMEGIADQSHQQEPTKASATHNSNQQESIKKERDAALMDESHNEVVINFKWGKYRTGTTISGRKSESLIDVLQKSRYFMKKYKESFTLLIHATKVTCALVNPCIPLGALPEGEELKISQKKVKPFRTQIYESSNGILIRVANKGKTLGGAVRVILLHNAYCPEGMTLGVFGYNDQTIMEAIVNDGRFNIGSECEFILEGGKGEEHNESQNKMSILSQNNRHTKYTIVFPDSEANATATSKSGTMENTDVSTKIPRYKGHKSMCNEPLYNEFVENFKKSYQTKRSWEILRKNFSNDITSRETTLATTHRLVTQHLDSVGLVTFRGSHDIIGSCFLLTGNLVVTCDHVLQDVLKEAQSMENIIIIFNYESAEDNNQIHYSVTEHVTSHPDLDFAILQLDDDQSDNPPPGLLEYLDFPPQYGAVRIIGHPENNVKLVDLCSVISYDQRVNTVRDSPYVHMATTYTFKEMGDPDLLTYNSCFYSGSSGSPVFNASGKLVAMHAGGYLVPGLNKKKSVIEYGRSMVQILTHWVLESGDLTGQQLINNNKEPNELKAFIQYLLQKHRPKQAANAPNSSSNTERPMDID
uniref:Serine protease n=1 Tax=Leptobrachium leishanense TaxID=445787 RepID=A0A8C5WH67_9ANUR